MLIAVPTFKVCILFIRIYPCMQNIVFSLMSVLLLPFGFLPLQWSQAIGSYLGALMIRYNKKRAHIARCNLQQCFPEKTHAEREVLLQRTAAESGKWFMESCYVWFRDPQYLINKVTVNNPEVLQTAYEKKRGVVIILPHLGNWELLNFYVPQNYPFGAMYKPVKSPIFENIIFKSRSRVGSSMFATDAHGVRKALKFLKKNGVIAILSDHLPSRKAAVYAPFFNYPVLTGKLTHSLVKSNQSEILLASVLRKPKGFGFDITFHPVEGIDTASTEEAATLLNQSIEKSILLAPEQYQWVYRRFAHPPEGVEDIYKREA